MCCLCGDDRHAPELATERVLARVPGGVITDVGRRARPPGSSVGLGALTVTRDGQLLPGALRRHSTPPGDADAGALLLPRPAAGAPSVPGLPDAVTFVPGSPSSPARLDVSRGSLRTPALELAPGTTVGLCELDDARLLHVSAAPDWTLTAQVIDTRDLTVLQASSLALDLPDASSTTWTAALAGDAADDGVTVSVALFWGTAAAERTITVDCAGTLTATPWTPCTTDRDAWRSAHTTPLQGTPTGELVSTPLSGSWSALAPGLWRYALDAPAPELAAGRATVGTTPLAGMEERALWVQSSAVPDGELARRVYPRLRGGLVQGGSGFGASYTSAADAWTALLAGTSVTTGTTGGLVALSPARPADITPLAADELTPLWWAPASGRGVALAAGQSLSLTYHVPPGARLGRVQLRTGRAGALTASSPVPVATTAPAPWGPVTPGVVTVVLTATSNSRIYAATLEVAS